jgi:hypothetical protein
LNDPIPVYGTGVELDRGAADPHWEITAISTDANFKPQQAVVEVPPAASYLPDSRAKAQWISDAKAPSSMPNSCRWTLRTRFDLAGFDPTTAHIEGLITVDDYLVEVRLNGKPVPLPDIPKGHWCLRRTPLKIEDGFTAGANTLEIVIENGIMRDNKYNPMGVLFECRGTAVRTASHEDAKQ